ncbi:N-acetylmuramoyl-L-alanine amidase [Zhihengliuella halotolerans]|uniref:N-acetylmuramoyl-L-alanine amidase n=1 Tax=Zhihengliuella halotolerans TaxID=370736 RepID=A0A4Q8ADV0_9MICC|nr:N-acetylmuramoyl-L-alanine amidase [Zhihengliuella halotolerans]RZU61729.1 N-acetylmuramoyl-L-alanine amidase [Zhihengliuella halotolerans]
MSSTGFILLDTPNKNTPQCRKTRRNNAKPTGTCVVHTAENFIDLIGEDSGAETVAKFIATRTGYGSYHFLCDSDSLVFMAPASYETWHDTATNNFSYGGSMAVRAGEWHRIPEDRRERIVKNCAAGFASYARWLKETYGITIPAKRITRAQAHRGEPGFLGHGDSDPGRRSDPGAAFDWKLFLEEFARLTNSKDAVDPAGATPTRKDWFDMVSKSEMSELLDERLEAFAARKPQMKGKAAEVFGQHHNSRDDVLSYGGLAWDQTRGLRDLIRELDAGTSAQEIADLIVERTDSVKAEAIVDAIAERLK